MKNENILKNNKGLSLVEIIIVIAIMTIIGGAMFLTTAIATDKHVTSCGEKVVSSLEQTRNLAMGKQSGWIIISKAPGDYLYCEMYVDGQPYGGSGNGDNKVSIGHSGLTITVVEEGGASYNLEGHSDVKIEFSRSNGSVTSSPAISQIIVTNGRKTVTISIDKFTGRVSSEKS